jgi:RHS repeat-associated protein
VSAFQYTGKPKDPATGLYYFGAHWYNPGTGRFVSEDSVTGAQVDPVSLNRYIYARDNPEAITDWNGHSWFSGLTRVLSNYSPSIWLSESFGSKGACPRLNSLASGRCVRQSSMI